MVSVPYLLVLADTDTTILVPIHRYWYRYRGNISNDQRDLTEFCTTVTPSLGFLWALRNPRMVWLRFSGEGFQSIARRAMLPANKWMHLGA